MFEFCRFLISFYRGITFDLSERRLRVQTSRPIFVRRGEDATAGTKCHTRNHLPVSTRLIFEFYFRLLAGDKISPEFVTRWEEIHDRRSRDIIILCSMIGRGSSSSWQIDRMWLCVQGLWRFRWIEAVKFMSGRHDVDFMFVSIAPGQGKESCSVVSSCKMFRNLLAIIVRFS